MVFNAKTKYRHCNMPFSNRDKTVIKNSYRFKNTVCTGYWQNFRRQTRKWKNRAIYWKDSGIM